jgi:hypothetical protein
MSAYNNKNNKKFCKVCQDAGKPESLFTSHFPRETNDRNSRVVCPTLLAQECRNCGKRGHTIKYCTVNMNNAVKKNPDTDTVKPREKEKQKNGLNRFECLHKDYCKKDKEKDKEVKEASVKTYASVLSAPIPEKLPHNFELISVSKLLEEKKQQLAAAQKPVIVPPTVVVKQRLNWALDYDDEDDDDDDEEDDGCREWKNDDEYFCGFRV